MAWLMITATAVIVFNLAADILYGILDPRVPLHLAQERAPSGRISARWPPLPTS